MESQRLRPHSDVSRITCGNIQLRKEVVKLATIMERALETSKPLIEERQHELTVSFPSETVQLEADPVRLEQILVNLLNNAAKYTDRGGRIELAAYREGDEAVLRVKDTGMGIPAHMLSSIFDPFVQAKGTVERPQSGLGIGLALVRRLVELHGGKIAAESAGPNRGSEFRLRLPARSADPVGREVPLPESANAPLPSPASRRILIVDDNLDLAECFAVLLKLDGHEVFVAADGPTALDVLPDFQPDVLISDIKMPGMDGCELARRIKEQPAMQHVLLVAITGLGQESDRQRCREAGFDLHLVKPIEPSELQALVVNPQLIPKRLDRRAAALATFAQRRWD